MATNLETLQLQCAERIVALVDALRAIPAGVAPERRAAVVAVREQIYYGYERPLSNARGQRLLFGKYEMDGWWSEAAAGLATSGAVIRGQSQLEREHVNPVGGIVADLLAASRTPAETVVLLEATLVTCTVLANEHRRLPRGVAGWARYEAAGVRVHRGLDAAAAAAAAGLTNSAPEAPPQFEH